MSQASTTSTQPAPDPLTPQRIGALVHAIAEHTGLDDTDAVLIKFTNNAVVRLPRSGAVIRIAGSAITRQRVPGVIAAAELFAAHQIPAVRLMPGLDQPIRQDGHLATVWRGIPDDGPDPAAADLARILTEIHALTASPRIPQWALPDGLRHRIRHTPDVDPDTRAFLTAELDRVQAALAELATIPPLIPPGIIHGDAHLGNLISTREGAVVCDFDSTSVGPREWDLVPAAVGSLRFGYSPDVHQGLAEAYGVDVTAWPGFPVLRRLRELQLVTSVLPVLNANPALRPQWEHRLRTYRNGDDNARWTPYATSA